MTEQVQLKVECHLINDASDYKDVDTYITEPSGEEWLFRTYLQKDDGEIVKVKPRYSPGKDQDFWDDGIKPAPAHVQAAYDAEMPRILELLEKGTISAPKTVVQSNLTGLTIAPAASLVGDFTFHIGDQKLVLKSDGLYFNGRKAETTQEQDEAFRSFLSTSAARSRIPLMIHTMSTGLRPATEFDAVEIHAHFGIEEDDGNDPSRVQAAD